VFHHRAREVEQFWRPENLLDVFSTTIMFEKEVEDFGGYLELHFITKNTGTSN
jgi:hypothetical protein